MLFNVDSKSLAKEINKTKHETKNPLQRAQSTCSRRLGLALLGILVEMPWPGIPDSSLLP